MCSAARSAPSSRSTSATRSSVQFRRPAITRKGCTNSRSTSTAMPSKIRPTASPLTSVTRAGKQRFVLRRITGARGRRPGCGRHRRGSGRDRRDGHWSKRFAHLGRQGRRPVLDRARCAACGRPCVPGRHDHRPERMGSEQGEEPVCRSDRIFDRARGARCRTARRHLRQEADRRVGRGDARHRRRRLALDQSRRPADDPSAVHAVQRRPR